MKIGIILLNTTKVTVSWTTPFTLNITGARGIFGYIVYIIDINCRNVSSEPVNEMQYSFITEENQCHRYSFQVSAVNAVGEGNRSSAILLPQPKQNVKKCSGMKILKRAICNIAVLMSLTSPDSTIHSHVILNICLYSVGSLDFLRHLKLRHTSNYIS